MNARSQLFEFVSKNNNSPVFRFLKNLETIKFAKYSILTRYFECNFKSCETRQVPEIVSAIFHTILIHRTTGKVNNNK
jgi:hypothetical protein